MPIRNRKTLNRQVSRMWVLSILGSQETEQMRAGFNHAITPESYRDHFSQSLHLKRIVTYEWLKGKHGDIVRLYGEKGAIPRDIFVELSNKYIAAMLKFQ